MKPHYILCMVLLVILIVPVSGENITITAEPLGGTLNIGPGAVTSFTVDVSKLQRNAIQRITVDVPTGSQIDYTLYYGNGTALSGQMIYNPSPGSCGSLVGIDAPCQHSSVSIGSSRSEHFYTGLQEQGRLDIIGYGRNEDTSQ
jgi:hypothetical protein